MLHYKRAIVFIYKGNFTRKLKFRTLMTGYKLGEFAFTKKPFFYPTRRKKKR